MKASTFTRVAAIACFFGFAAQAQATDLDASCPGAAAKLTTALEGIAGQQTDARQLQVALRIDKQRVANVQVGNATPEQRRAVRSALLGMRCGASTAAREDVQFAVQMLPPAATPEKMLATAAVAARTASSQ